MDIEVKKSLLNFPLALLSLVSVSLLWKSWSLLTLILLVIGVLMLLIEKERNTVLVYIAAGLGGAITEMVAIFFGVWTYTDPAIAGIPIWLPFLWGAAALYILRLKAFVDAVFRK
ncbi:DUF2878 family protein [Patescibacteria group bacterium]|nr:DUF2878 family protein [Patescibacteria group bacterium]